MGNSKDKQRRKLERDSGFDLRKNNKEAEAEQARRKQTRSAVIALVALAVVAVFVLFLNSNLYLRNMPALNVDGQRFSITDMNYYFGLTGSFDAASDLAQRETFLQRRAVEAGLTLTEDLQSEADEIIRIFTEDFRRLGEFGYDSTGSALVSFYGRGMNLRILRERLNFTFLAQTYEEYATANRRAAFTETELEAYYTEHRDMYDRVRYRLYQLHLMDGEGDANFLQTSAEEVRDAVESDGEAGFLRALQEVTGDHEHNFDDITVHDNLRVEVSWREFGDWLLDDSRSAGDFTAIDSDDGESVFLLYFLGMEDNRYYTADIRRILLSPETPSSFDEEGNPLDEVTFLLAFEEAMRVAEERADEIVAAWEAGPATEESFIALIAEYSEEIGNVGGLQENLGRQSHLVTQADNWPLDPDRRPGDITIIPTAQSIQILFFVGFNTEMYQRHILAADAKAGEEFRAWLDTELETLPDAQTTFFSRIVG